MFQARFLGRARSRNIAGSIRLDGGSPDQGVFNCKKLLLPQQSSSLAVGMAQVWNTPAATLVKVPAAGVACPVGEPAGHGVVHRAIAVAVDGIAVVDNAGVHGGVLVVAVGAVGHGAGGCWAGPVAGRGERMGRMRDR